MKRLPIILIAGFAVLYFYSSADCDYGNDIVDAARCQIGKTVIYDPAYHSLTYPDGDIPIDRGVCTDVVIRALRTALHFDLQKLVHEDMTENFSCYPNKWGLPYPDKNIDHRRVPNLRVFFKRQGWDLNISKRPEDYRPGDIVTCLIPPRLPHIMIVSNKNNRTGRPLVIHNIGDGTREEDRLLEFKITGHFRINRIQ